MIKKIFDPGGMGVDPTFTALLRGVNMLIEEHNKLCRIQVGDLGVDEIPCLLRQQDPNV